MKNVFKLLKHIIGTKIMYKKEGLQSPALSKIVQNYYSNSIYKCNICNNTFDYNEHDICPYCGSDIWE